MSKEKTEIDKAKQANAFHDRGFNCAQSVACVFADKTDLDEKTLFRVTEGLGLGMGCMDGTCGAICRRTGGPEMQHRTHGRPGFQSHLIRGCCFLHPRIQGKERQPCLS